MDVKMDSHGSAAQFQCKSHTHGHSVASKDTQWVAHIIYKQILQFFSRKGACYIIQFGAHSLVLGLQLAVSILEAQPKLAGVAWRQKYLTKTN